MSMITTFSPVPAHDVNVHDVIKYLPGLPYTARVTEQREYDEDIFLELWTEHDEYTTISYNYDEELWVKN